jgi:hypothetical protein
MNESFFIYFAVNALGTTSEFVLLQLSRVMALVLKPWYFGNDLTAVTGY